MDSQRQNRAQAGAMEPYKIVLKKITKAGNEWIIAPENPPADMPPAGLGIGFAPPNRPP